MLIKRSLSIKNKFLISYIIIVTVFVLTFTSILLSNSQRAIRDIALQNTEQIMFSSHQNLVILTDDIEYSLLKLQTNKTIQSILSSNDNSRLISDISVLDDILGGVDQIQHKISDIKLYAVNKNEYPSINMRGSVYSARGMQNDVWYKSMIAGDESVKWFDFHNGYSGKSYIAASKILSDHITGELLAVINAEINTDLFNDYLKYIRLANTGRLFIATPHHIISDEDDPLIKSFANHPALFELLGTSGSQSTYFDLDGKECLLMAYPLKDTELYLVGAVYTQEFSSNTKQIFNAAITTMPIVLIIMLLALYYISSLIIKPLFKLSHMMNNFSLADELPSETWSNDEVGALYKSFSTMKNVISNLVADVTNSSQLIRRSEINALQAQIAPHFLYNVLNSIVSMAKEYDAQNIEEMVNALATFFRLSINNDSEFSTIKAELDRAANYIRIQEIRFGGKFSLEVNVEENIYDYKISKLTLQPLVENCILHGFERIDYHGIIKIEGFKDDHDIYINVSDNGLGENIVCAEKVNKLAESFNVDGNSRGIQNVNQRIKLYFGSDYGLHYSINESGGFTVTVHIHDNPQNL